MNLPCQQRCSPWGPLYQVGANLLTLTVLEGEGEEEGIRGIKRWRRRWLAEGWDRRGEEQEVGKRRRMSSALSPATSCIPSLSRVPEATTLPDPSLVIHQWTYAICSWIIKETYATVTLWNNANTHIWKHACMLSTLLRILFRDFVKCRRSSDITQSRHNTKCTTQAQTH